MGQLDKTPQNFQIAILIEDLTDAKNLSDSLREIGIFAHYYQDLDEMWVALNTYTPDFSIIDVKRMSQGTLLFKQHQKVLNKSLKFSFYYKDSSKVLLRSTYGLSHYGYIRAEIDLVDQLKTVLRRRNEELRLEEQNHSLNNRIDRLRLRGKRLAELQEKNSFVQGQDEKLSSLIRSFGVVDSVEEFKRRVVTIFDQWEHCLEFGVYELNTTGQKLVSPKFNKAKYRNLPDLWLAKRSEKGINTFAQEMAFDVAYGLMNEEVLALKVQGSSMDPDLLIIGQFNQKKLQAFNWEFLEMKLSSEFRRAIVCENKKPQNSSHAQSVFEALQTMDDVNFNQAKSEHRQILVDFSSLVNFIKLRPTNRFFWKSFAKEFIDEVSTVLSGKFKVAAVDAGHFLISIEKRFIETDYTNLKNYLAEFQYWRYFEDSSLVVSTDVRPTLRFVAPSSVNLLRQTVEEDFQTHIPLDVESNPQLEM